MNTNKKTSRIVGVLFLSATVAGLFGLVFLGPIIDAPDFLTAVHINETQVKIGALFALIMAVVCAGIPIAVYPVLRKHNESIAIGYIVFRGGLEAVTHLSVVINWLLRLPLSHAYVEAEALDASNLQALGNLSLKAEEISSSIGTIVFCFGALMFYYLMYRSKLLTRWLSGWGLIATILYFTGGLLIMITFIDPSSAIRFVFDLPFAVQEMVMAVWLIIKGFDSAAFPSELDN